MSISGNFNFPAAKLYQQNFQNKQACSLSRTCASDNLSFEGKKIRTHQEVIVNGIPVMLPVDESTEKNNETGIVRSIKETMNVGEEGIAAAHTLINKVNKNITTPIRPELIGILQEKGLVDEQGNIPQEVQETIKKRCTSEHFRIKID